MTGGTEQKNSLQQCRGEYTDLKGDDQPPKDAFRGLLHLGQDKGCRVNERRLLFVALALVLCQGR